MIPLRSLLPLALALPLAAQSPFHADGTAVGGSRIFSRGLNPLGNLSRLEQSMEGVHLSWFDGGEEARDFQKHLNGLSATDPQPALDALAKDSWGRRLKGYALGFRDGKDLMSLGREESTALFAVAPGAFQLRRTQVDRLVLGSTTRADQFTFGAGIRVERWSHGRVDLDTAGLLAMDPWSFRDTPDRTIAANLDLGMQMELFQGLRLGATVDRLFRKRFWDIVEKPQVRAGLEMDLGTLATLSVESDLRAVVRMPWPVEQRTAAATLTLKANATFTLAAGAERRTVNGVDTTRAGLTVWFHPTGERQNRPTLIVGAGFQFGADRPLRSGSLWGSL